MSTLEHPDGDPSAGPPLEQSQDDEDGQDEPTAAPTQGEAPTATGSTEAPGDSTLGARVERATEPDATEPDDVAQAHEATPGDGDGKDRGEAPPSGGPADESDGSEASGEESTGSTLERDESTDPLDEAEITVDPTQVRHVPRFGRFATIGGLLGCVLGLMTAVLARYGEPGMVMDPWGLGLLMAAIFTPVGILIGCVLALLSDRRSRRRSSGS